MLAARARKSPLAGAQLAKGARMQIRPRNLIGVRHLRARGRPIKVLLTRNEGGSVAGQCILDGADRPIIDGPTVGDVMAAFEDSLDALLFARAQLANGITDE